MLILRKTCLFPSLPRTAGWDLERTRQLCGRAVYPSTDTLPQLLSRVPLQRDMLLAGFRLRGDWEQLRGSRAGNERNRSEGWGVAGGELCVSLHYGHLKLAAGQQNINIASSSQWTSVLSLDWKFKALRENADVWKEHPCFPPQCHQKRGTLCHSPKSLPL